MVTGGTNPGRTGIITNRERLPGARSQLKCSIMGVVGSAARLGDGREREVRTGSHEHKSLKRKIGRISFQRLKKIISR